MLFPKKPGARSAAAGAARKPLLAGFVADPNLMMSFANPTAAARFAKKAAATTRRATLPASPR